MIPMRGPRCALLLAAILLLAAPFSTSAAGPYEIRATWTDDVHRLTPPSVDFAFDAIDYVPRLGVVIYGDHLLLRIEHDEPLVTLGIAALHDQLAAVAYGSAAVLPDGRRLLARSTMGYEGGAAVRTTSVVQLDADGRGEKFFAFPPPSNGTEWTSIRLFSDADGRIFAYAGRARPRMVAIDFTEISPALEQRFYRYEERGWRELPFLDPATASATDACIVGGDFFVVGNRIEKSAEGKVIQRRGVVARLSHGRWTAVELDSVGGAEAFSMAGIRCGRTLDRVYALAVAAAPGQAIGHTYLRGPPSLYRYDGKVWNTVPLPERSVHESASHVTAFTIDRTGALWISFARAAAGTVGDALHRYKDGTWSAGLLPSVPEVALYSLTGIAFDDDGNGWAIANREGNSVVPESHGILLAYDGNDRNEWKFRGWKWHPLRQRWFGLFGNLR
jgi:hypothetical protein